VNHDNPASQKTAEKIESVKACCDMAQAGPKKEKAIKHCHAAETAHAAHNDAETHKELDAATHALV
jgi:hypothetical protein